MRVIAPPLPDAIALIKCWDTDWKHQFWQCVCENLVQKLPIFNANLLRHLRKYCRVSSHAHLILTRCLIIYLSPIIFKV